MTNNLLTTDRHTGESFRPADTSSDLTEWTVPTLLSVRAGEAPDRMALIGTSVTGAPVRQSYAELLTEARQVATALSRLADPGEMVALWAPTCTEWVVIQHGAAIAGLVLVALNPVFRRDELAYAVEHSRPRVLLHADRSREYDMAGVAAQVGARLPDMRLVSLSDTDVWHGDVVDDEVVAAAPVDADLPVMLQYTSGTTGQPKGVLLRHRSIVNVAKLTMEALEVPHAAACLHSLPMFHTAACVMGSLGPLWIGGTQIMVAQFVPSVVLETIEAEGVDMMFYVPALLSALLEEQRKSDRPAPTLAILAGGASNVPASMVEEAESVFGARVAVLFGQTELAPVLTITRPGDSRADLLATVGRPLPHVDVKIASTVTGDVVPLGETGEICARGYQQLIEYLHDPEATAMCVDVDGFVHTGDLGSLDERGFVTLTGRLKDLIIRGGENIAPAEVENCLVLHPAVVEAVVFGIPDDHWGEVVGAVVRLRGDQGDHEDLSESLRAHVAERLSPFKRPVRWWIAQADLPVTPTGKVQKFKLLEHVETDAVAPLTV